jgi:GNAT superfamily N-acetyltransferase
MGRSDLSLAEAIAEQVHPTLPEDPAVFAERLHLFPRGCLMLEGGGQCTGYTIAHPWWQIRPPALNTMLGQLPDGADTFFLHDLALLPSARGAGHAGIAVRLLAEQAKDMGLVTMSLVAAGTSRAFWRYLGFRPQDTDESAAAAVATYGSGACAMVWRF